MLTQVSVTDPRAASWPPKDPNPYPSSDPNHVFTLPESPWTYENGSVNPNLQPTNMARVASTSRRRRGRPGKREPISSVPPYHPDYRPPGDNDAFSDSPPSSDSESLDEEGGLKRPRKLFRRGSEGYEVHAIDREAMLRQYVEDQVHEPGRYNVYVPDPSSASEGEDEIPLAARVDSWRKANATV